MAKLIYLTLLCMVTSCLAWYHCRTMGGTCQKTLDAIPCNDPRGTVISHQGLPICHPSKPHCCIKSPGLVCHAGNKYGPKAYCMLPGQNFATCVDTTEFYPNGSYVPGETPFGLHMPYADHKCSKLGPIFEKTRCCTVAAQCAWAPSGKAPTDSAESDGWCGAADTDYWGNKTCRNGWHYPAGDYHCSKVKKPTPYSPLCCLVGPQSPGRPTPTTTTSSFTAPYGSSSFLSYSTYHSSSSDANGFPHESYALFSSAIERWSHPLDQSIIEQMSF